MQTRTRLIRTLLIAQAVLLFACKKNDDVVSSDITPPPPPPVIDLNAPLKNAAAFPIGVAISYTPMLTESKYAEAVKRDFNAVTFDYHMKHGAIVKNDGTLDFTKADELVNAVAGLEVFGHTLGWHQNQNATYIKANVGLTSGLSDEKLTNPGFEAELTNWSIFNSGSPAGSAAITITTAAGEIHGGASALKVVNPTAYPGNQWRVQVASQLIPTVVDQPYNIACWVKAATTGGSIRLSTSDQSGSNAQYQEDQAIGTSWQKISWTITAKSAQTRFLFDMGQAANTYYIDDASMKEITSPGTGPQTPALVDQALGSFITGTVSHFKGKVKAWDVVNELFTEDGSIRNNSNTPSGTDVFIWSHYLGKEYAVKAFNYAKAADPAALLYINDYNLESSPAKLNALIALVNELKGKGVKIDGIGTQMHISTSNSLSGIDQMMQKLAATGLKVRVSELDIRAGNGGTPGTPPSADALVKQAAMYKYVVNSYLRNVPVAQRAGITVWGLTDDTSWLYNNGAEYPLLYDKNYNKKPGYASFLQGLKGL